MRRSLWTPTAAAVAGVVALALAAGGPTAAADERAQLDARSPVAVHAARSCSSGYKPARINGVAKCLRAGQYCAHAYDRRAPHRYAYVHYHYRCVKQDARGSYHLTPA